MNFILVLYTSAKIMLLWLQRAWLGYVPTCENKKNVDVYKTHAKLIIFTTAEAWVCDATSTNHIKTLKPYIASNVGNNNFRIIVNLLYLPKKNKWCHAYICFFIS